MNIGITGSIACGKSTVSNYLKEKGYTIIDADNTDVRITAFIITAAISNPMFWKTIVKGDAVTLFVSNNLGSFAETIEDIINIVAI